MRSFVLLWFPLICIAQRQYLTTNDGSRLFFSSPNRLDGTDESFHSKLFSWDSAHGVRLIYESSAEEDVCCISLTGDGSLVAFTTISAKAQTSGELLDLRNGGV